VRARPSGATLFVDAQVVVPRTMPFDRAAKVKDELAAALRKELPQADISLALLPVELDDETAFDKVMLAASRQGVAVHHVAIHRLADNLAVSLDLEVDGAMPLGEAHGVASRLEDAIVGELGAGVEVESHIEPMLVQAVAGEDVPESIRTRIATLLGKLAEQDRRLTGIHDVRARNTPLGLQVIMHCHAGADGSVQDVHDAVQELEVRFREQMPEVKRLIGHAEP
jgi:divalent metal cation (Fe/Co/Zn/Cd) transporter